MHVQGKNNPQNTAKTLLDFNIEDPIQAKDTLPKYPHHIRDVRQDRLDIRCRRAAFRTRNSRSHSATRKCEQTRRQEGGRANGLGESDRLDVEQLVEQDWIYDASSGGPWIVYGQSALALSKILYD